MTRHLTDKDFRTDAEKWEFLRTAHKLDARDPAVQAVASGLWAAASKKPERFVKLAASYCRDVIRYQTDTDRVGEEDIQPAGELFDIIERGVDDCDGKARLFVALCCAVGIDAQMEPKWKPDPAQPGGQMLQHVFGSVNLGHGRGRTPVELTLYRARVGDEPTSVPKEVTGPNQGHWLRNDVSGA